MSVHLCGFSRCVSVLGFDSKLLNKTIEAQGDMQNRGISFSITFKITDSLQVWYKHSETQKKFGVLHFWCMQYPFGKLVSF